MVFFRAMSLTLKIALVSAAVALLAWLALETLYGQVAQGLLLGHALDNLEQHAQRDRTQLEQIVKGFHQSLQVMAHQKEFVDYIERVADADWVSGQPVHVTIHHHPPAWFPSNSVVRIFLPTRHAILLDGENRVREVYQHLRQTPSSLLPPSPLLLQLSRGDTFMTYLDEGIPYILTSDIIRRRSGRVLATLIFATPMDDQLLASLQARRDVGKSVLALFDGQENPEVLTSSDGAIIPPGSSLDTLRERFFVSALGMFDYGSSDLLVQFATLISKKETLGGVAVLVEHERPLWLFLSGLLLLPLLLVVAWLTWRMVRLQQQVAGAVAAVVPELVNQQIPGNHLLWLAAQNQLLLNHVQTVQQEVQGKNSTLAAQQATLRAILESVEDGLIILNQRGLVVSLNPAAERMFGWSPQEMIGHSLHRIMGDSLWERHAKCLTHYLPAAPSKVVGGHLEVTALRADGSSFPMDLRVSQLTLTEGQHFIGVLKDLTEQKQLALVGSLRESDRLFREILEIVPMAVLMFNLNGRITFCNDYFLQMTGWSRQEVLGEVWWDQFLPLNQRETARKFFDHTAILEEVHLSHHAFEAEVIAREGGVRVLLWHGVLLRDLDQNLRQHALIGEDITWRRKIDGEVAQVREEAVHAYRSRSAYVFRVKHEIRSPLGVIADLVNRLLQDQNTLPAATVACLQRIHQSTLSIIELFHNVVDNAQSEEVGTMPEEISPRLLVQGAYHLHQPEAQQKKLTYTYHVDDSVPPLIYAERALLNRLLMGLLVHAINAAPPAGEVALNASCEGAWLVLGVEDNGPHIHANLEENLFEPFYDKDASGRFAVASMALPLVKKAVEKLQGSITHKNLRHRGVAFTVRIPLSATTGPEVHP